MKWMNEAVWWALVWGFILLIFGITPADADVFTVSEKKNPYKNTIICRTGTDIFYIYEFNILYYMQDAKDGFQCLIAKDTEGKNRMICQVPNNDTVCIYTDKGAML